MDWYGYLVLVVGLVASFIIRWPHQDRHEKEPVAKSFKGPLEYILMIGVFLGMYVLPVLAWFFPWFSFANYSLKLPQFISGTLLLILSQYIFWRSHKDLGTNWSPSLDIRDSHSLVEEGVYKKIRHPMYTSFFLCSIAQILLIPNWFAGCAGFVAFTILYVLRIGIEEKMMQDKFGDLYMEYMKRTKRLVPYLY